MNTDPDAPETPRRDALNHAAGLLEDHLSLAALEAGLEAKLLGRKLLLVAVALALGAIALLWIEVALFFAFRHFGLGDGWTALLMIVLNGAAAGLCVRFACHRDPALGEPFEGSRDQWRRTRQWIQHLFS